MTVAIDAAGDAAGAFVERNSTTECATFIESATTTLELVAGTAGGAFAAPSVVDTASLSDFTIGTSISAPDIAIVPGQMLLAWDNGGFTSTNVQARQFDATGTPAGPAQTLATSTSPGVARLALDPAGGALAVFPTSGAAGVQAAARAPGAASFSAPVALGGSPSAGPAVAIDDAGDGVAVYDAGNTGAAVAQARGFDANPPSIGSASIPSAGTAGRPVQFGVQASDFWGPVTLSWDFGDGSAAAFGASLAHVFATPGTRTVTVTATDAAGNTAQASGAISVAALSVPGLSVIPALSRAAIKPTRFKQGHRALFTFTLNVPASVTIAFARRQPSHGHRGKHSKPRFSGAGALTLRGVAGANRVRFTGRVGRHTLPPGTYRATITATAGALKSKPVTLSFTITSRK
jgi:hypothetical protein